MDDMNHRLRSYTDELLRDAYTTRMTFALQPTMIYQPTPQTSRSRLRAWLEAHTPHIHFGPCDHSDCDPY
jgi:hypothetical protein